MLGWEPSISVRLDPCSDHDIELASTLAPYVIDGSGVSQSGGIIWSVGDTGTATVVDLLPAELSAVLDHVRDHEGRPEDVVPLDSYAQHVAFLGDSTGQHAPPQ
jgi:hypothetical protein